MKKGRIKRNKEGQIEYVRWKQKLMNNNSKRRPKVDLKWNLKQIYLMKKKIKNFKMLNIFGGKIILKKKRIWITKIKNLNNRNLVQKKEEIN